MKIHRAAAFAAKIGVHKNTVKAWSLKGKLPDRRTPSGHRYYTEADVERYFGVER
ncbi:MAG: MerR family transcriptional regulator, partial [Caldilineaceae bacterium SB0661_bin_34]|nr:MerR family transcriptional regulator [Caldilineaceae bacterium SB0661_bin_34]